MSKTRKTTLIPVILLVAVALIVTAVFAGKREKTYHTALDEFDSGNHQRAYQLFSSIQNYRDSGTYLEQILLRDPILPYRSVGKGEEIIFGHYEQDDDILNGPEPIHWLVLDRIEDQLLLLSVFALDGKPYHTESFAAVTWENSTLRTWLNTTFFTSAFTPEEQLFIPAFQNQNADQSEVGTKGGAETMDRVFLLSETEAVIYFGNEMDMDTIGKCYATDYAAHHNIETDKDGAVSWWLRSPGVYPYSAQFVDQNGKLYLSGAYTDIDYQFAVRPSIWIDLR